MTNGSENELELEQGILLSESQQYQWQQNLQKRAIEMAGIQPEEIDLILVSTISPNTILPCVACEVQKEVGAVHATCFD